MGAAIGTGLRFLMDLSSDDRVLFLDPTEGRALSEYNGRFDAVIAPGLAPGQIRQIHRILKPEGSLLVTQQNLLGTLGARGIQRDLRAVGFSNLKNYALYPDAVEASEIIGLGERPPLGALTPKGVLKERVLTHRLYPFFAQSRAWVATKNGSQQNFISTLLSALETRLGLRGSQRGLEITRYFLLNGKVILWITSTGTVRRSWVIKLPLADWTTRSLEHEADVLKLLSEGGLRQIANAPEFYFKGVHRGHPFYCMEFKKGISVDLAVPALKPLIEEAAQILTQLHEATTVQRTVDAELYNTHFAKPFDALGKQTGALRELEGTVRKAVMGRQLPLVWEHGDFYHENLMISPQTRAIAGVIDWEMSRPNGLPYLDLFHLIARTEMLYRDIDYPEAIANILALRFEGLGKKLWRLYSGRITVSRDLLFPLTVMSWVYRIQRSGGIRPDGAWTPAQVERIVAGLKRSKGRSG